MQNFSMTCIAAGFFNKNMWILKLDTKKKNQTPKNNVLPWSCSTSLFSELFFSGTDYYEMTSSISD